MSTGLASSAIEEQASPPGYSPDIDELRSSEFARYEGQVYADYAGTPPFGASLITAATQELLRSTYSNPHSASSSTSSMVERLRQQTLHMCNTTTDEYECIITSGATAALKLLADSLPWTKSSKFLYLVDNHTSVLGMRGVVLNHGGTCEAVTVIDRSNDSADYDLNTLYTTATSTNDNDTATNSNDDIRLFAYPQESNFDGTRYPLDYTTYFQQHQNCRVLLDAAKACSTHPPDLSLYPADFVVLSYYKIFGYPTGLGALLVRKDALAILDKSYFGGGTVDASSALDASFIKRRPGAAGFEDGTLPFLSIPAALHGFQFITKQLGGFKAIDAHSCAVAGALKSRLLSLVHANTGTPLAVVYTGNGNNHKNARNSSVVTFNIRDSQGQYISHRQVERLAALLNISLRTGCLCNPGACAQALGLSVDDVKAHVEAGHVCWGGDNGYDTGIINGTPTGVVRISFGYGSSLTDVEAIIRFLSDTFLTTTCISSISDIPLQPTSSSIRAIVEQLYIYPIKSCGACQVESWPLSTTHGGLLYDRQWAIVNVDTNTVMTLKTCPELARLQPSIDLDNDRLLIKSNDSDDVLEIPLSLYSDSGNDDGIANENIVNGCSARQQLSLSSSNDDEFITAWLTRVLNNSNADEDSLLLASNRSKPSTYKLVSAPSSSKHSFANTAQLLMINKASLQHLYESSLNNMVLNDYNNESLDTFVLRFRPNIVINAENSPFIEEEWRNGVAVNGMRFTSPGPCIRCDVVCFQPCSSMIRSKSVLMSVAQRRRERGGGPLSFGILLNRVYTNLDDDDGTSKKQQQLNTGDVVVPL